MANRQFRNDSKSYAEGIVYLDFSFVTNGTNSPVISYAPGTTCRGQGVASVNRTGQGTFTVTLQDGFRYIVSKYADLEDTASGGDGAYATVGPASNEGAGSSIPVTFTLYTRAVGSALTDYTGRRVSIFMALKNSAVAI